MPPPKAKGFTERAIVQCVTDQALIGVGQSTGQFDLGPAPPPNPKPPQLVLPDSGMEKPELSVPVVLARGWASPIPRTWTSPIPRSWASPTKCG